MKHVLTRPRNLKAPRACERIVFQWKRPGFIEKNIDILKSLGVDGTNNFHRALGRTSFGEEFYFGLLVVLEILDVFNNRRNVEGGKIVVKTRAKDSFV
jgi:hypothetical protein